MWAIALECIDKSSCSAHLVLLHRLNNETVHFLTKRATVWAASSPLRRLQNFVRFSGPVPVSSLPITRQKDSKIHGEAMEQKNRQTRAMLRKSSVNRPEFALDEFEGFK